MANGKVITGYSKPYVALYSATGGTVSYTSGQPLARGVSVNVTTETGDSVNFYADNITAESAGGVFTGATVSLVVDGLKDAARKLILGLPTATSETVNGVATQILEYDDRQEIPYVGIGFIIRYMEDGNTTYSPVVFPKAIFSEDGIEASTQEENIEFQTTELNATIMRDDSANHRWKRIAADQTSEQAAENVLRGLLGLSTTI